MRYKSVACPGRVTALISKIRNYGCLYCWLSNRVATLLEAATELRLYKLEEGTVFQSGMGVVSATGLCVFSGCLKTMGVEVVICGGQGKAAKDGFEVMGIQVFSWVKGSIKGVLRSCLIKNTTLGICLAADLELAA